MSGGCGKGGECEPVLSEDYEPPDHHCSKCGRYMRLA